MNAKCLVLALSSVLIGCASTSSEVGGDRRGLGEIAVDTVRAHHRASRAAILDTIALIGEAAGFRRSPVFEPGTPEPDDTALRSERAFDPTPMPHTAPYRDERDRRAASPVMQSIQMEVSAGEMLTPDGALHASAARALARMDNLAREHGGDLSVFVPRSRMHSAAAIRAVAPSARIFETDTEDNYRLIVVAAQR